jgi:hypothetical protein
VALIAKGVEAMKVPDNFPPGCEFVVSSSGDDWVRFPDGKVFKFSGDMPGEELELLPRSDLPKNGDFVPGPPQWAMHPLNGLDALTSTAKLEAIEKELLPLAAKKGKTKAEFSRMVKLEAMAERISSEMRSARIKAKTADPKYMAKIKEMPPIKAQGPSPLDGLVA